LGQYAVVPKSWRFSTRILLGFVALAIGPALCLAGIAYYRLRAVDEALALRTLRAEAQSRAAGIKMHLDSYREYARLLARHDPDLVVQGLARMQEGDSSAPLYGIATPQGVIQAPGETRTLDRTQLEEVREGGAVLIPPHVYVGAPLRDGGAVVVRIVVGEVLGLLRQLGHPGTGGEIHLVDRAGRLIGGGRTELRSDRESPLAIGMKALVRERGGIYVDNRGEERLATSARVGPWHVVAEMIRSKATGPLQDLALRLTALGAFFFVVVMLLLFWLARRTELSLVSMVASLERAARGEFGGELEDRAFAEIDQVKRAINAMHKSLAERDAEIMRQRHELFCQRCELERLNTEIVAADRMKSEFVANMSHEVRTPLHSILTLSSLLLQQASGPLTEEQRKQVGIIERNGGALFAMLGDILDFSKIEAGRVTVVPVKVSPGAVLAGVREAVAQQARAKGLDLAMEVAEDLASIRTDPEKLHRILLNLAQNAIKFTERGRVVLRCEPWEEGVAFEVADTGPGIADEDREKIFLPFRQADGSRRRALGGTGLGLAIVRNLTELMGGRIAVRSEVGRGTTFTVVLPLSIPATGAGGPRPVPGQGNVLIVAADASSGEAVRAALRAAGFEAGRAVCGRDVHAALDGGRIRTILVDARVFSAEGVDVFRSVAPQLAGSRVQVLGYWVHPREHQGGFLGELEVRPAGDGEEGNYRMECEVGPSLALPARVTEEVRTAGVRWAERIVRQDPRPFREVMERLVRRLDAALVEPSDVAAAGSGGRILILDPDGDSRYSTRLQLEGLGYEVVAAASLDSIAGDLAFGLVLMEASLPGVRNAVGAVRARIQAPILVVTADARTRTRADVRRAGASAVLVKPVPFTRLRQVLARFRPGREVST